MSLFYFFFRFYLFLERGDRREKEKEISVYYCLLRAPHWGPGPQPRHVP